MIMEKEFSKKDKKIIGENFSRASDKIISLIEKRFNTKATDVEKLDGYFIFNYGVNSVLNFHLDNCPGWKFGVWWSDPQKEKRKRKEVFPDYVRGTFFAQYEETIDKFKPSASRIVTNFVVYIDNQDLSDYLDYGVKDIVKFISAEPALAFCRDYLSWNYNAGYHAREEAEEEFKKYKTQHEKEVRINKECDEKMLNFVRENVLPLFNDSEIFDHGEYWCPRYEVYVKLESNTDIFLEPGCYSWFDDEDEDGQEIIERYQEYKESLEKYAKDNDVHWWCCIDEGLVVYKDGKKPFCDEE